MDDVLIYPEGVSWFLVLFGVVGRKSLSTLHSNRSDLQSRTAKLLPGELGSYKGGRKHWDSTRTTRYQVNCMCLG